jgi:hypothetical protein
MATELSDAERQILWEQFVEVYAESQESYDKSVRTLAAAGVAVTTSLATALHGITCSGIAAVSVFLLSLALNLGSYGTVQIDMLTRTGELRSGTHPPRERNGCTTATTVLNVLAGVGVLVGGVLLAWFVAANA